MFDFRKLLSVFFPERCPFCNEIISADKVVCASCEAKINAKTIKSTLVTRGGQKFICVAPFAYVEPIRTAIHKYKFHGVKCFAVPFGRYITDILRENFDVTKIDLITSVPLHRARQKERGFNQSELFAREISRLTGIKYVEVLKKVKKNKIQHELSGLERIENVKGVYAAADEVDLVGKTLVICDDILTTGNTMAECANVVFGKGARQVIGVTIATAKSKMKIVDKKQRT